MFADSPASCAPFPHGRRNGGPGADPNPRPFGIAVREMSDDAQTFLAIANDSPYPIRLAGLLDVPATAPVEDLGRGLRLSPVPEAGGRNLVLDLLPFGVAAIRVACACASSSRPSRPIRPRPSWPICRHDSTS